MIIIYEIISLLLLIFSPIILLIRIILKKEDAFRLLEKFGINSKLKNKKNLIWFHGCSVGELLSIIPLVKRLEKNRKIDQILITTTTLSSAKVFKNFKFKKTIHQYFPLDNFFLCNIFLNYWKPKLAFFIESEIWPSFYTNIKRRSIPLILLNARITKKTFKKWHKIRFISKSIFDKIDIAYPQNFSSKKFLSNLGLKKNIFIGNLKYSYNFDKKKNNSYAKKFNTRMTWCAASTHDGEEDEILKTHISLKKKYKKLLTIIIPRHIHRSKNIIENILSHNLNYCLHSSKKKIKKDIDIYLVDTYGETIKFYNICNNVFLGKSLSVSGGQNPLEPARLGCNIFHGPKVENFSEIYKVLKKVKISNQIRNSNELIKILDLNLMKKRNMNYKKIKIIGDKILKRYLLAINKYL